MGKVETLKGVSNKGKDREEGGGSGVLWKSNMSPRTATVGAADAACREIMICFPLFCCK